MDQSDGCRVNLISLTSSAQLSWDVFALQNCLNQSFCIRWRLLWSNCPSIEYLSSEREIPVWKMICHNVVEYQFKREHMYKLYNTTNSVSKKNCQLCLRVWCKPGWDTLLHPQPYLRVILSYLLTYKEWQRPDKMQHTTQARNKHHHHGDGAANPSGGMDLMNPCRPRGRGPWA